MPSAKIMTGGNRFSTIPYGDKWRRMRKAAHAELNAANVKQYNFVVNYQSHRLLQDLIEQPENFHNLAKEFATGVVIRAVYDLDTGKTSHPIVKDLKGHSSTIITTFTPGQALMDLFRKFGPTN
jgi:cytochrome P450